MCISWTD